MAATVITQTGPERFFNRPMDRLARHGFGPMGMQQLIVRGRSSGEERTAVLRAPDLPR